jgi:cation transport protein ChaC
VLWEKTNFERRDRTLNDFDPLAGPTPLGIAIPKVIDRPNRDFWVFAYGSLIWNPGFVVEETRAVSVWGFHRRFCVRSTFYRGTEANPGLVVGLRPGGRVSGVVHRVAAARADEALSYLEDRELRHDGYRHVQVSARDAQGQIVPALTFMVPDASHSFQPLSDAEIAQTLAFAAGNNGTNAAYLFNLNEGLRRVGIAPGQLDRLERAVRTLQDAATA